MKTLVFASHLTPIMHMLTLLCFRRGFPIFCFYDGETNLTFLVYVWMVYLGEERQFRRLEGVLGGKTYLYPECSLIVRHSFLKNTVCVDIFLHTFSTADGTKIIAYTTFWIINKQQETNENNFIRITGVPNYY